MTTKHALRLAALLWSTALAVPAVRAEAPAADPPSWQAAVVETRNVQVPMRDGVHLSVDIYSPREPGPKPAILTATPYDNSTGREEARWYAKHGYVVVLADVRGKYDSEGTFDPFDPRHKTDGYDLVEWIAAQPWSTGKVGMMGGSYLGWMQWWTASTAPPHLVAIVPQVAPPDAFANAPYQNGVLTGGWLIDWAAQMAGRTAQSAGPGAYAGWSAHRGDLAHTPYADINHYRGLADSPWFETWYKSNLSTAPYWQAIAYQTPDHYAQIKVPSLAFTGWFDPNQPGTPINYAGMKRYGANAAARKPFMVVGPWSHNGTAMIGDNRHRQFVGGIDYGAEARFDAQALILRWFDHYLRGQDNGIEREDPVRLFVMGENKWHVEKDWPLPQTRFTRYFLAPKGGIATTAPAAAACDGYDYDPRHPTRDAFGLSPENNGHIPGAIDTRPSVDAGVLVYETPALTRAVEVTGPIEAVLYAATSARDTDWFVRLVDVQPDGRALMLAEGAMRARNRDEASGGGFNAAKLSTIEPGKVLPYRVGFWRNTANLFQPGHKIRVEISSSWFPYFLPNLNTGDDNAAYATIDRAVIAKQRICTGGKTSSYLLLPIIPARTAG